MKLLEIKEQLTLKELMRIAYEYGNDNADMPADNECVEKEFSEWIKDADHLFKKLILPDVSGSTSTCCGVPHDNHTCSICGNVVF